MNLLRKNWIPYFDKYNIRINPDLHEQNITCPFHEDRSPSCSINLKQSLWFCHSGCGGGKLEDFFKDLGESEFEELSLSLQDVMEKFDLPSKAIKDSNFLPSVVLPWVNTITLPEFILDRGFSIDSAFRWGFVVSDDGSLVIPVNSLDGQMVGWVCRKMPGKMPKYVYSAGLEKSKVLFGADKITMMNNFLVIVEGSLDAIWLDQNGFDAVAILGGYISKRQFDIIEELRPTEVVTCFDNDDVGRRLTGDVFDYFSNRRLVSCANLPKNKKDIQDVKNKSEIQQIIKNRTIIYGGFV